MEHNLDEQTSNGGGGVPYQELDSSEKQPTSSNPLITVIDWIFCGCCSCCRYPCSPCLSYSRRVVWSLSIVLVIASLVMLFGSGAIDSAFAPLEEVDTQTVPIPPTQISAKDIGYDFIDLLWSEPASSNGRGAGTNSIADKYVVWVSKSLPPIAAKKQPAEIIFESSYDGKRMGLNDWSVRLEGLEPGKSRCVQVCGENSAGQGECSEVYCFKTLSPEVPSSPGPPTVLSANDTSLHIRIPRSTERGYPIMAYELQCRRVGGPRGGGRSRFRTIGLLPSEMLPPSTSLSSSPSSLSSSSSSSSSSLQSSIHYLIEGCPSSPLKSGTYYEVRARAICDSGTGKWSESSIMHTNVKSPLPGPPFPPGYDSTTKSSSMSDGSLSSSPAVVSRILPTSVTISWKRPKDNGSEITSYHLHYRATPPGCREWTNISIPARPSFQGEVQFELTNLKPSASFEVTVAAENSLGVGAFSTIASFTTACAVKPSRVGTILPRVLNATCTRLEFHKPSGGGMDIEEYQVETDDWYWYRTSFETRESIWLQNAAATSSASSSSSSSAAAAAAAKPAGDQDSSGSSSYESVLLANLLPTGTYNARIRARNAAGWGEWSKSISFETPENGHCGTRQNIHVYQEIPDIKDRLGDCMIGCHPLRVANSKSCAEACIMRTLGLSEECAKCYSDSSYCIIRRCALQCINPKAQICTNCNKAKCVPILQKCTGIPDWGLKIPY